MSITSNSRIAPVNQIAYEARGKAKRSWVRETHAFTINGVPGVSLSEALGGRLSGLDGREDLVFQGLGQKITYHLLVCLLSPRYTTPKLMIDPVPWL